MISGSSATNMKSLFLPAFALVSLLVSPSASSYHGKQQNTCHTVYEDVSTPHCSTSYEQVGFIFSSKLDSLFILSTTKLIVLFNLLCLQECTTEYKNQCSTEYSQECTTEYSNQCKTDYQQECTTEHNRQCNTEYSNQCTTEYENECKTDYQQECTTDYKEECKTDYDTVCLSCSYSYLHFYLPGLPWWVQAAV